MKVRRATLADVKNLAVLGAATFANSFGHLYKPEDMQAFIDEAHSESCYKQALSGEIEPIWVAEAKNGQLAGFIKLCPNSLPCDPPLPGAIEISKLYILNEFQGRQLGSQLVRAAENWSHERGVQDMVLSVYSENYDGQKFYVRHGFAKIGDYLFPVGEQLDQEFIFRKRL